MIRTLIFLLLATALPVAGFAHHSHSNLNRDDVRLYSGVVKKFGWNMPHAYLVVTAPDLNGEVVDYVIEMGNPPSLAQRGWDRDIFKPGERITWEGAHDRNPNRHYTGLKWAERADGTRVGMNVNAFQKSDGVAKSIQPSTDFSGLWKRCDPAKPGSDRPCGFNPHYKPPKGWPLTAVAQTLVDNFHEDQNPMVNCKDPGPPKFSLLPYPIQIDRPDDKTIIITGEMRPEPRVIHLDRDHAPSGSSSWGHSVGWFEGDELVVETTDFVADKWGSHTGIDSSDQKHLIERYSLSNNGMKLNVVMTVTDPVYLAEPVTFSHHWRKLVDRDLVKAPCTLDAAQLFLKGIQ